MPRRNRGTKDSGIEPGLSGTFSIQELEDYAHCPLKHLYGRHPIFKDKGLARNSTIAEMRIATVKEVVLDCCEALRKGEVVFPDVLKKDFDSRFMLYLKERDIHPESVPNQLAMGRMEVFGNYSSLTSKGKIVAAKLPINHLFRFMGPKGACLRITDTIDAIRVVETKRKPRVELIHFYTDHKPRTSFELDNSVSSALYATCFLREYAEDLTRATPYAVNSNPNIVFTHLQSQDERTVTPSKEMLEVTTSWLYNLHKALKQKIYYQNVTKECTNCPFKKNCNPHDVRQVAQIRTQ